VVAFSRGALAAEAAMDVRALPTAGKAALDGYRRQRADHVKRGWYAVRLQDLSRSEVLEMVDDRRLPFGFDRQSVTSAIFKFSGGHPHSTKMLVDAVALSEGGGVVHLADILDRQFHEEDSPGTVRELLTQRVLPKPLKDRRLMQALVTSAAAQTSDQAALLYEHSGLVDRRFPFAAIAGLELWIPDGRGEERRLMHPVARLLLLEELRARPDKHPANWSAVHGWLRDQAEHAGDDAGQLYHALALGEAPYVTRQLHDQLGAVSSKDWLALLHAATVAPSPLRWVCDPVGHLEALTSWAADEDAALGPLARIVVGLWIDADPLLSSARNTLHDLIASAYDQLVARALTAFTAEAARHRRIAQDWDPPCPVHYHGE
jgi:hypothetical protein